MADRLAGLITKHLARTRPAFPAVAAATAAAATALEADARKVLYYASRDKDPRVAAAAAQSLLVLISAGSEAGEAAAAAVVQATAAAGLQDYLQHKKTRLQQGWCQQLLGRCSEAVTAGDAAGLQALLTACSKGRNEAVKAKAVQLLPSLVTGRTQQQVPELLAVLKQHQGLVASALAAGVVGPYKNKEQHAAAVKAVVSLLGGVVKQGGGKRLAEVVGSETVRELGKSVVVVKVGTGVGVLGWGVGWGGREGGVRGWCVHMCVAGGSGVEWDVVVQSMRCEQSHCCIDWLHQQCLLLDA